MARRWWIRGCSVAVCGPFMVLGGCANPGPVRPPSLNLPKIASDVLAERWGDEVRLSWTAPTTTTDGLLLPGAQSQSSFKTKRKAHTGALAAEICRQESSAEACKPVARVTVQAGEHARWQDHLSGSLTNGAPALLQYRVRILNASGRDAGWSRPAAVPSGATPAPMEGLQARSVRRGVQLRWNRVAERSRERTGETVRIVREAIEEGKSPGGAQSNVPLATIAPKKAEADRRVELTVSAVEDSTGLLSDPGGAVDTAIQIGASYRYTVYRERAVSTGGETLTVRGTAATVEIGAVKDTFAPSAPAGLLAISTPAEATHKASIALSWEPVMEADVAGYTVYRQDQRGGAWTRISAKPVATTAFEDTDVKAGGRYRYRVAAIDRLGNESAPSDVVTENVPMTAE